MDYEQPKGDEPKPEKPDGAIDIDPTDEQVSGYPEDEENLVPFFAKTEKGKEFLARVAKQICDDFERGWESCEAWREKVAENNRIMTGFLKKKDLPFEGCANAHTPLMFERSLRLVSNVFVEIFLERETIYGVQPNGPDDYDQAEILSLHGNWQVKHQLTDFIRQRHRDMWDFFTAGSAFTHSYYDPVKRRNRHDALNCDEFVIPYVWTTVEPDMSDVPYKVRILKKYKTDLEDLRDTGEWASVDDVIAKPPPAWDDKHETKARDMGAKREGIIAPDRDPNAPYVLYMYNGHTRMPGDKRQRPICAIADSQTKTVVKLYIREETDWLDQARYDQQLQELEQYQQDIQAFQQTQQQEQELRMSLANPEFAPEDRMEIEGALGADQLQPPVPPHWLEAKQGLPPEQQQPEPVRKIPIELFSHGVCVENPFGALGISFGTILADQNRLADEAYNRVYDAATLGNIWSLIVPDGLDFQGTKIPFGPGKVVRVKNMTGEQLNQNIKELKPGPANMQLMEVVRMAQEDADGAVAAPGVLSGEPGKSGETYRGIATRVERATKQLSAAGIKYLEYLSNILKNNARLNSIYMPDEEVVLVANHLVMRQEFANLYGTGQPPQAPGQPPPTPEKVYVGRDMYRRSYNVTFTADVRFASQAQRVSEADEVLAMVQSLPPLQNNHAFVYAAVAKALRARGLHDMIPLLGPAPAPPDVPIGTPPPPPPGMEGMPPEGMPPEGMPPMGPPPEGGPA